jgi:hypothetical protein
VYELKLLSIKGGEMKRTIATLAICLLLAASSSAFASSQNEWNSNWDSGHNNFQGIAQWTQAYFFNPGLVQLFARTGDNERGRSGLALFCGSGDQTPQGFIRPSGANGWQAVWNDPSGNKFDGRFNDGGGNNNPNCVRVVPEPVSAALFLLGGGALAFVRRRK